MYRDNNFAVFFFFFGLYHHCRKHMYSPLGYSKSILHHILNGI